MKRIQPLATTLTLVSALSLGASGIAHGGDRWYVSTSISALAATYSGSEQRNSQQSSSLLVSADYLDNAGVTLFYNRSEIDFKAINGVDNDIEQNAFATRLHYRFFSDTLAGSLTPQLVLQGISNNDVTTRSDEVSVIAPRLAYLSYGKRFYVDLEYSLSRYPNNSDLEISQWSAGIGLGFNRRADWLSLRPYVITSSDERLTQGESSVQALELKWLHWFGPDAFLGVRQLSLGAMAGKRMYAVDHDSFAVYNLADMQEGSLQAGLSWALPAGMNLTSILGSEQYNNSAINNRYRQNYLYLNLSKQW